jgi:hypothetical protein
MESFQFEEVSEFHKKILKPKPDGPRPMNLGLVLSESLRFSKEPEPGLELVDILTNATRRALRGQSTARRLAGNSDDYGSTRRTRFRHSIRVSRKRPSFRTAGRSKRSISAPGRCSPRRIIARNGDLAEKVVERQCRLRPGSRQTPLSLTTRVTTFLLTHERRPPISSQAVEPPSGQGPEIYFHVVGHVSHDRMYARASKSRERPTALPRAWRQRAHLPAVWRAPAQAQTP